MKAAIYCRLSKEDADKALPGQASESIQNQRAMLEQYAADHGYTVTNVYCDEDYSGADRTRPAFNRMLEAARRREFDVILAKTQSRFTRDMELVEKYLHGKFPEWGIRFIAVVDHVDTGDTAGRKARQLNGLINQWYLEDLSENVRSVLTHKRRQGAYIASFALYGYAKDPHDHNRLVIDPPAAAVVRQIFALCLQGCSTAAIARRLNDAAIPPPSAYRQQGRGVPDPGARWSRATLHQMLTNRTYTGDLVQGRQKKLSYRSARTVRLPKGEWIIVPGTHAAIIDQADFAKAQQQLAARAKRRRP